MSREIVRALPELELQGSARDGSLATVVGRLAVWNEWTEIESAFEGHFMERIAPGSFLKTIERDKARYRVLYEHGKDPTIARKVLGPIQELREDDRGAFYAFALLDTDYGRSLLPGLEAGLYGSSFRGTFENESFDRYPESSPHNPNQLPERTVREVSMLDFGPCPFPAYVGATAGTRSLTDWWHGTESTTWTPARRRERLLEIL